MNQIKYNLLCICLCLFSMSWVSCDLGEEPVIEGVAIQEMTGEWWVTFTVGGEDIYGLGYTLISTYNTASNSTSEMFLDDLEHTWAFKVRVPINFESRTFSGSELANLTYEITVNVSNGLITKGSTESTGGNITDGISFDVEFSDDPGTVYHMEGYRRTGFQEDEH